MLTKLDRVWQIILSEPELREAGFHQGQILECRVSPGVLQIAPEGEKTGLPVQSKKNYGPKRRFRSAYWVL